jgi:hypothetical protein
MEFVPERFDEDASKQEQWTPDGWSLWQKAGIRLLEECGVERIQWTPEFVEATSRRLGTATVLLRLGVKKPTWDALDRLTREIDGRRPPAERRLAGLD